MIIQLAHMCRWQPLGGQNHKCAEDESSNLSEAAMEISHTISVRELNIWE
jgi:hypothetical protein